MEKNPTKGSGKKCELSLKPLKSNEWDVPGGFLSEADEMLLVRFKLITGRTPVCSQNITTVQIPAHPDDNYQADMSYVFEISGELVETTYNDEDDTSGVVRTHLVEHFCIDPSPDALIFRICPPLCNDQEPCIRKCCPPGYHFHFDTKECVILNKIAGPNRPLPFFGLKNQSENIGANLTKATRVALGHGFIQTCPLNLVISTGWKFAGDRKPYKVTSNGSILLFHGDVNMWKPYKFKDYCVDHFYSGVNGTTLCEDEMDAIYVCGGAFAGTSTKENKLKWLKILASITLIIALVCLLLTAIVVFLLIDRVNLHSWTRLSFVISEFIFLFLFSLIFSERFQSPSRYPKSCKAFAVIFHFTGLMTMCWLSIINFDLWWTFKVLKPTSSQKFDIRRYICYVCFALGVPLAIVSTALGIQHSRPRFQPSVSSAPDLICRKDVEEKIRIDMEIRKSKIISPEYGERSCNLAVASLGAYWYGPLCFLLLANLIFFFATTSRMVSLRRMTRRASIESTSGQQSQSNQIFTKIFIVSGVTWNIELIGWLCGVDGKYRLDIVHHVQAMALFYIFVCKKEVIRNLQRKYPIITKVIPPVSSLHRSATIASMSTDASSRTRVGRKLSNASDNCIVGQSFQRQESFDLQVSPPSKPSPELV
ncbi:unnamed protein product [Allacma fusca]|uniref:G-protein coupled receptors family 2 profile 2 domain-containing protein n=1 Tax=Allacma fusca TaxID=39272 RepID=A0A8J2JHE6_9HEXA|nr:unnamed protein product [Allacma fusca]